MAGRGPAPKDPGQRRNRHAPQRGEWVDLVPLEKPVLGVADAGWCESARALWVGWRGDPVTACWGSSEVAAARELALRWDELPPNEQRLRMDGLGLSLKGKRDLRYRLPAPEGLGDVPVRPRLAEVRRLRAVDAA